MNKRLKAKSMDTVISHHSTKPNKSAIVSELPNHQRYQPPKQSHPTVILNRLKPQSQEIIVEEQAGFRAGRKTGKPILNLRALCEKYVHRQHDLYRVFIIFLEDMTMYGMHHYELQLRNRGAREVAWRTPCTTPLASRSERSSELRANYLRICVHIYIATLIAGLTYSLSCVFLSEWYIS